MLFYTCVNFKYPPTHEESSLNEHLTIKLPLKVYIYILTAQRIGRMLSCTCDSFKYPLTNRAYMSSYFIKKRRGPT